MSGINLTAQLAACQQHTDQALERILQALPFQSTPLVAAMRDSVLSGGKRLRPFLVYATGALLGIEQARLDAPATAIELIHAYSLIHDDLPAMDDDDLRRGRPTCHIQFGEAAAILAGDALQALAFQILTAEENGLEPMQQLAMVRELARASGVDGMCGGQMLDLNAEGAAISLTELEQIHRHKTGALIRAAVRLGSLASAAPLPTAVRKALDQYAEAIGLAFQVQDDILDVIGDSQTTGKRQGADQELGKNTYPALLGLDGAQQKAQDLQRESLRALNTLATHGYDTALLQALTTFIVERNN